MIVPARKVLVALLFLFGFALPVFVHVGQAQTASEIEQQIANLLERLDDLQKQMQAQSLTSGIPATSVAGAGGAGNSILSGGLSLLRDLERGVSGGDISSLQQFLARDAAIYPEAQVTGFFGPLTEEAVKRFQLACGIVSNGDYTSTGYGRVGPRTRAALLNGCAGYYQGVAQTPTPQGVVGGFMRVTPTVGPAPLQVTVAVTANTARSCEANSYTLDFGDGSRPVEVNLPAGYCAELTQHIPHAYTQTGEYTLTLRSGYHYATTRVTVGTVAGGTPAATGTVGTPYPSFSYRNKTYALGSQEHVGPLSLYEYALSGETINNWSELFTFGRDRTLAGAATLVDLDGAAEQTLDMMRQQGATVHRTFTQQSTQDQSRIYDVIIMAFPLSSYVELDIRKIYLIHGEIVSVTYGRKAALAGNSSAQAVMDAFFAEMDNGGATAFIEQDFYLPWLVTYVVNQSTSGTPTTTSVDPALSITPGYSGNTLDVKASFTLADSCTPFTFNWGDTSIPISRAQGSSGCIAPDVQTLVHTYPASSGTNYALTLTYGPAGNQGMRTASIVVAGPLSM